MTSLKTRRRTNKEVIKDKEKEALKRQQIINEEENESNNENDET